MVDYLLREIKDKEDSQTRNFIIKFLSPNKLNIKPLNLPLRRNFKRSSDNTEYLI